MENQPSTRRSVITGLGTAAVLSLAPTIGAAERLSGKNFDPHEFTEVFQFIQQYRDASPTERRQMESQLRSIEMEAVGDALRPVETTMYEFGYTGGRNTLRQSSGVELAQHSDVQFQTFSVSTPRREGQPAEHWNWDVEAIKQSVQEDEEATLSLESTLEVPERVARNSNSSSQRSLAQESITPSSTGSTSYSYVIEKNNLGGYSTAFRWEHNIMWDYTNSGTNIGDVSNTTNQHSPLHSTWFMSYNGLVDEWEQIRNYSVPGEVADAEDYESYMMGFFEQTVPIIGVSNYTGSPYSELAGTFLGYGTYNSSNTGLND
jgi:hypothetical protein